MTRTMVVMCLALAACGADPNLGEIEQEIGWGSDDPVAVPTNICGWSGGHTPVYGRCLVSKDSAEHSGPNATATWSCTGYMSVAATYLPDHNWVGTSGFEIIAGVKFPATNAYGYNVHAELVHDFACDTCQIYYCKGTPPKDP